MKIYALLFVLGFSFPFTLTQEHLFKYCEWVWKGGRCEGTCNIIGTEIKCDCSPWPRKGCNCNGQYFADFGGPNC